MASHFNDFLSRRAFRETSYKYDSVNFGNEFLELRDEDCCLLFINGRGCLEIRIRPLTDDRWIDISLFLEFLGRPLDLSNVKNIYHAEDLAPVYSPALQTHFGTIIDLLQPHHVDNTWLQFDVFLNERANRLYGPRT